MKTLVLLVCFFSTFYLYAVEVKNLTDQEDEIAKRARDALFNNTPASPGVRVALLDMKQHNKNFMIGGVDEKVREYERQLSRLGSSLKQQGINVTINKTDFKGYYITCTPTGTCNEKVARELNNMQDVKFQDGTPLKTQKVTAQNYQEGYIKARVATNYQDIDFSKQKLHQFIQDEMNQAIKEASLNGALDKSALSEAIDAYRSGRQVDSRYKRLVTALDTLLETPFVGSNNLDQEMVRALKEDGSSLLKLSKENPGQFKVRQLANGKVLTTAQSGDDLYMFVKEGNELSNFVGVDARGLGNANMQTRLDEYLKAQDNIKSMDDLLNVSHQAIKSADEVMEQSFGLYVDTLEREFVANPAIDLERAIENTSDKMAQLKNRRINMLGMRVAIERSCGEDLKCIKNQITVIHNNLKKLENAGESDRVATSCLSSFYWVKKLGL